MNLFLECSCLLVCFRLSNWHTWYIPITHWPSKQGQGLRGFFHINHRWWFLFVTLWDFWDFVYKWVLPIWGFLVRVSVTSIFVPAFPTGWHKVCLKYRNLRSPLDSWLSRLVRLQKPSVAVPSAVRMKGRQWLYPACWGVCGSLLLRWFCHHRPHTLDGRVGYFSPTTGAPVYCPESSLCQREPGLWQPCVSAAGN